jgi:tetratricopeptide (TPR) repeat protein
LKVRAVIFAIVPALLVAQPPPPRAPGHSTQAQYRAARQLLQQKNWSRAAAIFEELLNRNPGTAEAHVGLGVAQWGLGNRDRALAAFRRAVELSPGSAEARYNIALAFRDFGENQRAMTELESALKLDPGHGGARMMLALLMQQSGQADRAIGHYRIFLKSNPRSAEGHNWLGVALLQKPAVKEAMAEFREAIRLNPRYARAHNNLGSALAETGDIDAAVREFTVGLKYEPADLQLRLNLGMALRTKGDADGAIREFRTVLERYPSVPEVQYQIGQTLRQKGDLEGAAAAFEEALAADPESREAYYGLSQTLKQLASAKQRPPAPKTTSPADEHLQRGREFAARGDAPAARESLLKAVQADPRNAEAWNLLGFTQGRLRELQPALASLTKAVTLRPELADARYNLGVALWYSGDKSQSAAELDEALRFNPAAGEAYAFRGMVYRDAGDVEKARRCLQRALALSPTLPAAYVDLAIVFLRMGRLEHAAGQLEAVLNLPGRTGAAPDTDLAIRELRQALERRPNYAEAHNVLGRLLGAAGAEAGQVIAAFEAAIAIRPEYAEAHNNLGLVYTQTGDDDKAIGAFRAAIRFQPQYAEAHANLGAVLTPTNPALAVDELETAVRLQPASVSANFNLAIAYGLSTEHGALLEIQQLKKVVELDPNFSRARFALGKALVRNGAAAEAIAQLEAAIKLNPDYGEAHYQLGLALTRESRMDEARAALERGRRLIADSQRDQSATLDLSEGRQALASGKFDHAVAKFGQVAKAKPDAAEAHYYLGVALARRGDEAGARTSLLKALDLNPWHAGAKESLDTLAVTAGGEDPEFVAAVERQIRAGQLKEAFDGLSAHLREHPKSSWGWYALGYVQFGQQKIGDAIRSLARSLELNGRDPEAHKVLGRCLMVIGRFDAAQLEFEQAARLNPRSAEVRYNLGKLFSIQDNWARARSEFEHALRLDADYMEAFDGLGFALEALGENDSAVANYRKAIELNEARHAGYSAPYTNLSTFYSRKGSAAEGLEYARKAVRVNTNSDRAWFQLARTEELSGDLNRAAEALSRAIAINPGVASYHYVAGTIFRRLGKHQESRQSFDTFARLQRDSNEVETKRREALREGSRVTGSQDRLNE